MDQVADYISVNNTTDTTYSKRDLTLLFLTEESDIHVYLGI